MLVFMGCGLFLYINPAKTSATISKPEVFICTLFFKRNVSLFYLFFLMTQSIFFLMTLGQGRVIRKNRCIKGVFLLEKSVSRPVEFQTDCHSFLRTLALQSSVFSIYSIHFTNRLAMSMHMHICMICETFCICHGYITTRNPVH